ncbi:MAG: HYR domain-containing protein, partial [Bacteroidota bacterium]
SGRDCEGLQITHTDYVFFTAEPACFKLIRNWAIINWCVYEPNAPGSPGFWEHTQVIEVRDSVAPVLICPANFTKGIEGTGCQAFVEVPLPLVDDCSDQVTLTNNGFFAQNATGNASGIYPKGIHEITYTAADGCGNTSTCSLQLQVVDAQEPNPVCNNGISVTIQQNGFVTVTPGMIDNGSYDNCSPKPKLVLQVSPNTFSCQDLGTKTVTLTVTDEGGQSAFCQTNVVVQDNLDVCPGANVATIAGKLTAANGVPLSQKLVGLTGGLSIGKQTDVDGTYDFPNLPVGMDYELAPAYNVKPLNGVTTLDMVFIRRHILGVEYLDSPYKIIAADVNKSSSVTTFDLVELRKLILNVATSFPNGNTSWRFIPASYVFPDSSNPFSQPFPEKIEYDNLETSQWEQNFVGIKVGDVNGSADPGSFGDESAGLRNLEGFVNLIFKTKDIELNAGAEHATPFVASFLNGLDTSVAGFQFTIDYDENALELIGIEPGEGMEASHFGKLDGAVAVSWEDASASAVSTS